MGYVHMILGSPFIVAGMLCNQAFKFFWTGWVISREHM